MHLNCGNLLRSLDRLMRLLGHDMAVFCKSEMVFISIVIYMMGNKTGVHRCAFHTKIFVHPYDHRREVKRWVGPSRPRTRPGEVEGFKLHVYIYSTAQII